MPASPPSWKSQEAWLITNGTPVQEIPLKRICNINLVRRQFAKSQAQSWLQSPLWPHIAPRNPPKSSTMLNPSTLLRSRSLVGPSWQSVGRPRCKETAHCTGTPQGCRGSTRKWRSPITPRNGQPTEATTRITALMTSLAHHLAAFPYENTCAGWNVLVEESAHEQHVR